MAAKTTEIERLMVRLVGDAKPYIQALQKAQSETAKFTQDAQGRFRDAAGKYVSAQEVIRASTRLTIAKLQAYGGALKDVGSTVTKIGGTMKSLGASLSLRVTAPIVALGTASAKTFSEFEKTLGQMQGLAGVAAGEIGGITKELKALAVETGKGPSELAESLYNIRSAGVTGQTALDTLEVSAKAAAAGLGETRVVSDAVTSVLNAYGVEVISASRATDIMVAAVREGKAEASELAPVLGRLIPVAASMGIQFQEVAGVMAIMSRTGLDAAEASTSVGAILATLTKPSKEAADTLASAGLSMELLRDTAKKPGGLIDVMRILHKTFGNDEEALAKIVPEVRAFRGVMNVLSQDAGIVDNIMQNVADSVGATESAFAAGADTIDRKWNQMMAEVKNALIDLGVVLKPTIVEITNLIKGLSGAFQSLSPETQQLVAKFLALAAAVGPATIVLDSFTSGIGKTISGIVSLMGSLKSFTLLVGAARLGMIGLGLGITAAAMAIINKYHPAAEQMRKDLEDQKRLSEELSQSFDKRFNKQMQGVGNLPVDQQKAQLELMKRDMEMSLESTKQQIGNFNEEIKFLTNADGRNGIWGAIADAQGAELAKGHLEDARRRAAQLEAQLEAVNGQLEGLSGQGGSAKTELETLDIRPEAIKKFEEELTKQLSDLEVEFGGKEGGLTDGQISRRQAMLALERELEAEGKSVNDAEYERIRILDEQATLVEKQLQLREEEEKKAKEAADKAKQRQEELARKAAQVIEASLNPIEEMQSKVRDIQELTAAGALTQQEAMKAKQNIVTEFATQNAVKQTAGSAIRFGSAESELSQRSKADPKSLEKGIWKLVENAEFQQRNEADILTELRKISSPEVISFK